MRKFDGSRLLVATHNRGKLDEIASLLGPFGISIVSAAEMGLPEPAETETSFVGNARIKAHAAARATNLPALSDDSGICVDVLGGQPGVYTADWAETPTGRDFMLAMTRTWQEICQSGGNAPFNAQFRCTLVLAWPDGHDEVFEGVMAGQVIWPPRGNLGHGYDPIFLPDGYALTCGEMVPAEKNTISHRGDAFRKLVAGCFT
jgi:XTP/dITP diphosphohydrolase